jgi:hypothetical protein
MATTLMTALDPPPSETPFNALGRTDTAHALRTELLESLSFSPSAAAPLSQWTTTGSGGSNSI